MIGSRVAVAVAGDWGLLAMPPGEGEVGGGGGGWRGEDRRVSN